ncbi:trypsin-like serine protease [Euzebya tangerina]|uniref:trypsin-like serine protease n=1 Tax=Euzebya tangerina TaxID=591198 RepID=UPI0013C2F536|nr:trypsin-like serine protease [Euzebya tangerina]
MKRVLTLVLALCLGLSAVPAAAVGHTTSDTFAIVNGQPADPGEYPWMAAFLEDGGQACGASVIAPNWILTAAHCVIDGRGQPSITPDRLSFVVNANNWVTEGDEVTAAQIIPHPDYDPGTTNNDMALVRTNEMTNVTPVRLAGPNDLALNAPPTTATVIGYGAIRTDGPASDVLLEVDVDVVSDADCAQGYNLVPDTMVCAGNPTNDVNNPGRDSCQGDSGGPLFDVVNGEPVQFGVVSFGGICGVDNAGVYAQVTTYTEWINGVTGGVIDAGDPDPGPAGAQPTGNEADPNRIQGADGDNPVDNAIAMSQRVFRTEAAFGVLALSSNFPDALGGSALASYFGPLLYVNADASLDPRTVAEFQRVVPDNGTIYILGGTAVIGLEVDETLRQAGFTPVRLAGAGRQQTAALVADEVNQVVNGGLTPPFDGVFIAFEGNWPDAVAVGSLSAWFGIPVLLTPTDALGGPAAEYLRTNQPGYVGILGGDAVISQAVRDEIGGIVPADATIRELEGPTRIETAAAIAAETRALFQRNDEVFEFEGESITTPDTIVTVNLRRDDAFAHVLAASQIVGNFGGVFAPLEGDGTEVQQSVLDSVCGLDAQVLAIGSTNLVADGVLPTIQQAAQAPCA